VIRRAVADSSLLLVQAGTAALWALPGEVAVSVVTAAELELAVLGAREQEARARRLARLSALRSSFPLLEINAQTASCFAHVADTALRRGLRPSVHQLWIAALALQHDAAVASLDPSFPELGVTPLMRVDP
jgi:predicted nucleic acid-binding protein